MTAAIQDLLLPFVAILLEMAPLLLLGLLIAGLLHSFMPKSFYRQYLASNDLRSVLTSLLFGIPLPLCSCGVIPTAVGMRREGASKGATTAFLISTPQTGIDSIMSTYSVLGLPFAILRPMVALVTRLIGGLLTNRFNRSDAEMLSCPSTDCPTPGNPPTNLIGKLREAFRYGFSQMIQDIGLWLIIGLIMAGLINVLVPDNFFLTFQDKPLLSILLILVIACPMYVCATGSIPIAAALMLKGLTPGAALVFLMAGPATNVASIVVLGKTLGRRSLIIYLATILLGAITFGLITDLILPRIWFALPLDFARHAGCHTLPTFHFSIWQIVSAIVLTLLIVKAMAKRFSKNINNHQTTKEMKTYKITGMMCNHCRAHVEKAIMQTPGVTSVNVDLAANIAQVEGTASAEAIIQSVTQCGYGCEA